MSLQYAVMAGQRERGVFPTPVLRSKLFNALDVSGRLQFRPTPSSLSRAAQRVWDSSPLRLPRSSASPMRPGWTNTVRSAARGFDTHDPTIPDAPDKTKSAPSEVDVRLSGKGSSAGMGMDWSSPGWRVNGKSAPLARANDRPEQPNRRDSFVRLSVEHLEINVSRTIEWRAHFRVLLPRTARRHGPRSS